MVNPIVSKICDVLNAIDPHLHGLACKWMTHQGFFFFLNEMLDEVVANYYKTLIDTDTTCNIGVEDYLLVKIALDFLRLRVHQALQYKNLVYARAISN